MIDDRKTCSQGILRAINSNGITIKLNYAFVGNMSPAEHLDQRALSCPVFPKQGKALTGMELQVDVLESMHSGKTLMNAPHAKQGGARSIRDWLSLAHGGLFI